MATKHKLLVAWEPSQRGNLWCSGCGYVVAATDDKGHFHSRANVRLVQRVPFAPHPVEATLVTIHEFDTERFERDGVESWPIVEQYAVCER